MILQRPLISFVSSALSSKGGPRSKENGAGRVTGLGDQRVEIAMMRTSRRPRHGSLSVSTPPAVADHRNAPVNALGYLRVMFAVDDHRRDARRGSASAARSS